MLVYLCKLQYNQTVNISVQHFPVTVNSAAVAVHNCVILIAAPSGRWGHAVAVLGNQNLLVVGGQGAKQQIVKDSLWLLNTGQPSQNQMVGSSLSCLLGSFDHLLTYSRGPIPFYCIWESLSLLLPTNTVSYSSKYV